MLQLAHGLPRSALDAIAALERRVVDADGGRLKLEWGSLSTRPGDRVDDLLWWQDTRLVGFLGLYAFGTSVELAGMVDPASRRNGIATALLDAALPLCHERGYRPALLVVPGRSAAGRSLALHRGAVLDHSEHALVLRGEPAEGPSDPTISVRRAVPADAHEVARLLQIGFGFPATGIADQLGSDREQTLLIEQAGAVVGTLRLTRTGEDAGVYGFVVDAAWQGRGIGRDALRRVCRQLRSEGARQVGLEVTVDNDRALGLYTSMGFTPVTTEDYYALPVR